MNFSGKRVCSKSLVVGSGLLVALTRGVAAEESRSTMSDAPSPAAETALGVSTGSDPDHGIPLLGWLLYPTFTSGVIFNDNLYQIRTNRIAGVGLRIMPSLKGVLDNGLHKSTIYFRADAQIYPGQGGLTRFAPMPVNYHTPTNVSGRAGFSHLWSPLEDLGVGLVVDYSRQNGLMGSDFGVASRGVNISSNGIVSNTPQFQNQYSAYVSVEKKFSDRWFVRATTGAQYIAYDSQPSEPYWSRWLYSPNFFRPSDGLAYTAALRGGYWLTPQIYGFVQSAADLRFYRNSWSDTNGYNVIAGVGSDLIGLFRGEIHGGYQRQMSAHDYFGSTSSPAFGARIFYYPTRYITVTASLDQTLSSGVDQTSNAFGVPFWPALSRGFAAASSRTLTARLQADYSFSQYWSAYVRGAFGETRFSNPSNLQTQWTAGVGLSYNFWRSVDVNMQYQFAKTSASFSNNWWAATGANWLTASFWNGAPSGYSQNIISAGLTYRY